ncbi:glycosyltransferase family 4 protein [uncultured Pontibacter sp.]|uniref:glycosyltransferase family 4 protein n=1 Tax=uncultured Pontibacter sp. TaxID=453356 RepID=UPI002603091D|nr:glycosyltransferase family 4 protein [uncultured Pontibacter sp.]
MLSNDISTKILNVGPDYVTNKGGMPAAIKMYSKLYNPFQFIPTYFAKKGISAHILSLRQIFVIYMYLLRNTQIQVVHIHGASKGSFYRKYIIFLLSKYLFGKKVVYHVHSGAFPVFFNNSNLVVKTCIRHFINTTDAVICLSDFWKGFFSQTFKPKELLVLRNMVEHVSCENYTRRFENTGDGKVIFLFLGMIREQKGTFDMVRAASMLDEKYKNAFEIWIAGDGEVEALKRSISEHNLDSNIKYLGWLDGEDKNQVLRKANVLVLPSHFEGSPVSILEAMAYGMPIISSNVGGIPELVIDDYNGILNRPGDTAAIRDSFLFFLENKEQLKLFGINSLKISKKHHVSSVFPSICTVYSNMISTNL